MSTRWLVRNDINMELGWVASHFWGNEPSSPPPASTSREETTSNPIERLPLPPPLPLESLSNSRRRRRSGRPEVKMHYWRLLRMRKTKLESSFSSGRLATRVSEVVFGRWVFIHFFCLLSNMPWKHNHISVFLMIFWNQRYLSDSGWRNWSFLLIEELSPLL